MSQPYTYIITHPGRAHRDEFYACCFISGQFPGIPIERRIPTPEELEDPKVIVIDTGGHYEPEKSNFDHHQFEPAAAESNDHKCALSLWLDHQGLLQKAKEYFRWLEICELADCHGPHAMALRLNTDWDTLAPFVASPLEELVLQEFSRRSRIHPNAFQDWLSQVMTTFGGTLLRVLESSDEVDEELSNIAVFTEVKGIKILGFTNPYIQQRHATRTENWAKRKHPDIGIIIFPDNRDPNKTCLYRVGAQPRVDFLKIQENPLTSFAHKTGFIAKVDTLDRGEIRLLIEAAID